MTIGVIWGLALFGILLILFLKRLPDWFSITFYVFMGWLCIIAIFPMVQALEIGALIWIFTGGLFYTVGAIILGLDKPNLFPKKFRLGPFITRICISSSDPLVPLNCTSYFASYINNIQLIFPWGIWTYRWLPIFSRLMFPWLSSKWPSQEFECCISMYV